MTVKLAKVAQKSDEPSSETLCYMSQRPYSLDGYFRIRVIATRFVLDRLTRGYRCKRSHNKLYNWHADSPRRTVVRLSRERTTPRISSWTSLKYYIQFSFILKLIIFIYKQLKRPVAFSVVHLSTWALLSTMRVKSSRSCWCCPLSSASTASVCLWWRFFLFFAWGHWSWQTRAWSSTYRILQCILKSSRAPSVATLNYRWSLSLSF